MFEKPTLDLIVKQRTERSAMMHKALKYTPAQIIMESILDI